MPLPDPLVRAIRTDLGIELTPSEVASVGNRRDLYYLLQNKALAAARRMPCPGSHAFYQLRRALIDTFGVDRAAVTPDAPVSSLFPPGRLFPAWRRLTKASGLALPPLRTRPWLATLIGYLVGIPAAVVGFILLMELMGSILQDQSLPEALTVLAASGALAALLYGIHRGLSELAAVALPTSLNDQLTVRRLLQQVLSKRRYGIAEWWQKHYRLQGVEPWHATVSICHANRLGLRDALVAFMREEIWISGFVEALERIEDADPAVSWLVGVAITSFDDPDYLHDQPIGVDRRFWSYLCRLVAALDSGLPLHVQRYRKLDLESPLPEIAWEPFWSSEQWREHAPRLERYDLPAYDEAVHAWRLGRQRETLADWSDAESPGVFGLYMTPFRLTQYKYSTLMVEQPPRYY